MDIRSFILMSQSLKIKANLLLPHEYWLYLNFPKNDLDNLALQVSPFLKLSAACPTLVELERMQLWMVHICIANKLDLITLHIYIYQSLKAMNVYSTYTLENSCYHLFFALSSMNIGTAPSSGSSASCTTVVWSPSPMCWSHSLTLQKILNG